MAAHNDGDGDDVISDEHCTLTCTCAIESISSTTSSRTDSKYYKQVNVILGRNEFRDIIVMLQSSPSAKASSRISVKYPLQEIAIHRKFVKEGKATIKINDKVQLLLSNCPPHRLATFIKCLMVKHSHLKHTPVVSNRHKMLSDKPASFTEISPLNAKDMEHVVTTVNKQKENRIMPQQGNRLHRSSTNANIMETPKSKSHTGTAQRVAGQSKRTLADLTNTPGKVHPHVRKRNNDNKTPTKVPSGSQLLSKYQSRFKLTGEQWSVVNAVKTGKSIFFTGSAGTGKSFLLKKIVGMLPPEGTVVTASTGVAACMVGGTTLHAFAGIGGGNADISGCYELATRPGIKQGWLRCKVLIIDEVSMVSAEYFDKLEQVARYVRRNDQPFGGVQLVLCGDFLQLPPVMKRQDSAESGKVFCFQSSAWSKCIDVNMELTEVKRQTDQKFIKILQAIRMGVCTEAMCEVLQSTCNNQHLLEAQTAAGILATKLCTHKDDVDLINNRELDKLPGEARVFSSEDSDPAHSRHLDSVCPAVARLHLKVGAQVMLIKNLDVDKGLVNGARGVVTGFDKQNSGRPVVQFACGAKLTMRTHRWGRPQHSGAAQGPGGGHSSRQQLPLRLAWAFSVHRAQGMTLDCVQVSVSKVWECGQAYVALSRAKSLRALRVIDFDRHCVRAHPHVIRFYRDLRLHNDTIPTPCSRS